MTENKSGTTPLAAAIGAALIGSVATTAASADQNPFGMTNLSSGYMVAEKEGKCGGAKKANEGKCGGEKGMDKQMEGKCGGEKGMSEGKDKQMEGKCGGKK